MSKQALFRDCKKNIKSKVCFLRFNIDTLSQNYIYDETDHFNKYDTIYLSAQLLRNNRKIKHLVFPNLKPFWSKDWPFVPKDLFALYDCEIQKIASIIKRINVKLIHAQFATDAIFFHQLIYKTTIPTLITLRGHDLVFLKKYPRAFDLINTIQKIIVRSNDLKNELVTFGVKPGKIEIIYGGINTDKFFFKPREFARKNLKLLSAGRFVEKKGFDTTLIFFKRLLSDYPRAHLTLIGEGNQSFEMKKFIKKNNMQSSVTIKNFLLHSDFVKELYRHHIFVLPSKMALDNNREGIPNVLKEAMISGMPVISTYHGGIPELIKNEETGFLVKENKPDEILNKVDWIFQNAAKTKEICIKAHFFVKKQFDVKKTSQQLERLYDDFLLPVDIQTIRHALNNEKPKKFRVDIHLTAGCNGHCLMCDNWKNDARSSFKRHNISRLLDELKSFGVTYIRFHGQEPTLYKDLLFVLQKAKEKGFRIGLKTNSLFFDRKERIRRFGIMLDALYLSIDAADKNTHNKLRGSKKSFAANRRLAIEIKKLNPDIKIYLNSVITKVNYGSLDRMLDVGQELRCDRISFVHLNKKNKKDIKNLRLSLYEMRDFYLCIWPRILQKSLEYNIPVNVDPYLYSLLDKPIENQISLLRENPQDFRDEIANFSRGLYGKTFYDHVTCRGVLDHVTIDWEGNVFPCCAMPRNKSLSVGNVFKKTFLEIWSNDRYTSYRKKILSGLCPFKIECSRNFKQALEIDHFFKNEPSVNSDYNLRQQFQYRPYADRNKAQMMLAYAYMYSIFYRKKWKNPRNLTQLPPTTKNELKSAFTSSENLPNYFEDPITICRTSSCGQDTFLYARPRQRNYFPRMASSFIQTGGWKIGDPWLKLASLNCLETAVPFNQDYRNDTNNMLRLTIIPPREDFLHAPIENILKIHKLIKTSKARFIHADPIYLKLLLYRFKKEGLSLDNKYIVHSTYELLLPSTKKLIEKYLSCRVFDQYGCSEIGPIAFSCRFGHPHIFTQSVKVETLAMEIQDRPDVGRIAVTDLENTVMPFIKYLTGDIAYRYPSVKRNCGIIQPVLGKILGRENEAIIYKGKTVFPLELDSIFLDLDNILMYQVVFREGSFLVKVVPENNEKTIQNNLICERFADYFNDPDLKIMVEPVKTIAPRHRGKYKTVIIE